MEIMQTQEGSIIEVQVKPNSDKFDVLVDDSKIVILCTETPTKGKANKELLKKLSVFFGHKVKIVTGRTSRQKRLLIKCVEKGELERFLLSC